LTRVLFLTESFHPVLGGGETHIRRLGSALAAEGDRATVVTRRAQAAWPEAEDVDGTHVVRVPPAGPGRTGKFWMVPPALRALSREAPSHDVVVVRGTRVLGLPGLLAGRAWGRPVVLQPEINGELSGEAFTWGKAWAEGTPGRALARAVALRNLFLRDADACVAMSTPIRDEMIRAGIREERIALIPHGVDTERFRPASPPERAALRESLGLPPGRIAVYTGRLLKGKGLETLLDALAAARESAPELSLVLVGSGEDQALSVEDELRRRAGGPALAGSVRFAGRSERVEDWLRAADLFVFPSVFEALGISLVEAAACGLPAVASRTGGIVDVVQPEASGLLVPPGQLAPLSRALVALAKDEDRRRSMGAAARRIVLQRFDERDGLARYRALFREVSSPRPSSSRPARAPRAGAGPLRWPGARA
jgi:glycosyltransferase involved in cell wall biosynthesis